MNQSLYIRSILRKKKGKFDPLDFYSSAEEASWYAEGYNLTSLFVPKPAFGSGAGYWRNEKLQKSILESRPHGDFKTDYPYFVLREKRSGNSFIGGESRSFDLRNPSKIYTRKGYCSANATNATWIGGQPAPHSTAYQKTKSSALIAISDAISAEIPQWDVLTDLAELGDTGNLFKSGVGFLVGVVDGITSRDPKKILRAFGVKTTRRRENHVNRTIKREFSRASSFAEARVRTAGSLWLTYRYGVMPMLYSFDDAIRAIHTPSAALKRDFQVTFRDRANVSPRKRFTSNMGPANNPANGIYDVETEAYNDYSYRIRARVDFSLSWKNRFGLTPWAAARVLWEKVPFSFVWDWFHDVGGWLQRLDLPNLVSSIDLVGTLKDYCRSRAFISNPRQISAQAGYVKYSWSTREVIGQVDLRELRTFKREILSYTAPPPNLEWGLNRFKRQLDTAALLLGRTKFR